MGREQSDFPVEKADKHCISQVTKASSQIINHRDGIYSGYKVMKMALDLCNLPPNNPQPQFYHEKNIRKIPVVNYLHSTPQNRQGHQKQGKSEKELWP
jgi:hypothetical protein